MSSSAGSPATPTPLWENIDRCITSYRTNYFIPNFLHRIGIQAPPDSEGMYSLQKKKKKKEEKKKGGGKKQTYTQKGSRSYNMEIWKRVSNFLSQSTGI